MINIKVQICDFCGTCVGVCPEDAIILRKSDIEIDREKCINCGRCVLICPLGVLETEE